jgi:capsular exopolysaccharide synthesis family protein
MSRIHEALKKAEQERAGQGTQPDPNQTVARTYTEPAAPMMRGETQPTSSFNTASAFSFDALLARCPQSRWTPDLKTMLFFQEEEHKYGTEEFRTLRSRLYQLRERQPLKKILVTSALPKEGKSFVSANLAQVMVRQHGRRALLIDADLRGPKLHNTLGATPAPGLAEYLRDESDEFGVMQRGPMENLFFISAGHANANPAELLANGRLKFLLSRLEPLFDWIIIDSPPAVPVTDGVLLSSYCDGVLMVVRSNATPFDLARRARQEFRDKNVVGVVLNGIDEGSSPYSEYYYAAYGRPAGKS